MIKPAAFEHIVLHVHFKVNCKGNCMLKFGLPLSDLPTSGLPSSPLPPADKFV